MALTTKAKAAQAARIAAVVATIGEQMGLEYSDALETYAAVNGNGWPEKLTQVDWYLGRDANFTAPDGTPLGHLLRQVRNHPTHGPAMYEAING